MNRGPEQRRGRPDGPRILRPAPDGRLMPEQIAVCRKAAAAGGLLAFPTDTVYGVGADARCPEAVGKLFAAKRRSADKPLPVLVAGPEAVGELARDIPEVAWRLIEAFWPGPLTVVLRRTAAICREAVAGGDTVGLRMPDHSVALQVLRAVEVPLAVTSANVSGEESTVSSAEVLATLGHTLEVLVEDSGLGSGVASTVVDVTAPVLRVLRMGTVGIAELREVSGQLIQG